MMKLRPSCQVVVAAGAFALAACQSGAAGNAVRPEPKTAAETLGEGTCHEVGAEGHPLIVDWPAEERSDLEVALRQGVPAVHYDCASVKLLRDCRLDGRLSFVGTSMKETVVRLEDADEIRANLPFHGLALGSGLERGSTIDVALVLVGQRTTTWRSAAVTDLRGACAGATHFIRAVHVGAFAMDTGAQGRVRSAAELLGKDVGASSSSVRKMIAREGVLEDCKDARPDMVSPPPQCGAPVRLELSAIGAVPAAPTDDAVLVDAACPKGLVSAQGKCATPGTVAYKCDSRDARACAEQCEKGNAESCTSFGAMQKDGMFGVARDPGRALATLQRACDGGSPSGCLRLAQALTQPPVDDRPRAFALVQATCNGGYAPACRHLATMYRIGIGVAHNQILAARTLQRGCDGGDPLACMELGDMAMRGLGMPKDDLAAVGYYERACDGLPGGPGCTKAARMLLAGEGVPRDTPRALALLTRLCNASASNCDLLARVHETGYGVPVDEAKAFALYDRACTAVQDRFSCARRAEMQANGRGTAKDEVAAVAALKEQCAVEHGSGPGCIELARLMQVGHGVPLEADKALAMLLPMCGPPFQRTIRRACKPVGVAYADGLGTRRDLEIARRALQIACVREFDVSWDPQACQRLDRLGDGTKN